MGSDVLWPQVPFFYLGDAPSIFLSLNFSICNISMHLTELGGLKEIVSI